MSFGGQGARREAGSEGYAEKYRAVVDEGYLKDEPVGQRWDTVEPALWGRRRSHSPTAPRCLRTARYSEVESSLSERPEHHRPRRLADWINSTGARKVHSLIDKVYKRKNLEIAWERVRANHGAGGIDGESIEAFG